MQPRVARFLSAQSSVAAMWRLSLTIHNTFPRFCPSSQLLYAPPVLLSAHVSSRDQRSVCGLQELPVPASLTLPETHFAPRAALLEAPDPGKMSTSTTNKYIPQRKLYWCHRLGIVDCAMCVRLGRNSLHNLSINNQS